MTNPGATYTQISCDWNDNIFDLGKKNIQKFLEPRKTHTTTVFYLDLETKVHSSPSKPEETKEL